MCGCISVMLCCCAAVLCAVCCVLCAVPCCVLCCWWCAAVLLCCVLCAIAMDSGETVTISAISHTGRRHFLNALFSHERFPAELHSGGGMGGGGWAKAADCKCIRRTVLEGLVENGDVINPMELSRGQARAARMAPVLQALLRKVPALIGELGQLLSLLGGGETVDLGGMDNRDVKRALSQCLGEIGI
jgi:hypothetical protein